MTLYAWANPIGGGGTAPVDHTWVTDFDNTSHHYPNIGAVLGAGRNYWYSWGAYHASGSTPSYPNGLLGKQAGSTPLAKCLVMPNADCTSTHAARGTVFTYLVDGVCHQLANQILYATGAGGRHLTVVGARGYAASSFLYGTYGRQHAAWRAKIAACSAAVSLPAGGGPGTTVTTPIMTPDDPGPDDFAKLAEDVLAGDQELLRRLLALRSQVQSFISQPFPGSEAASAAFLNARNQHFIDEAAKLLGDEKFEQLFGYDPKLRIDLSNPELADK